MVTSLQPRTGPVAPLAGATRLSVALVAGTLVLSVVARDALAAAGPALLAVAAVAGLPHGAADVTLLRGGWRPLAVYAVAAAAALAVALALPGPALVVLLLLSVAHFAEGEQSFDRLRGGAGRLLPAIAIGWCAVAVPLSAHPSEVRPLLADLSVPVADAVLSPVGRVALLGSAAVLVAAVLVSALLLSGAPGSGSRGSGSPGSGSPGSGAASGDRLIAGEVLVVAALLALAPPLAGFAVWFAGWHAVRHTARLVAEQPGTGLAELARRTALPSLVAAVGLVALVGLAGGVPPAVVLGLLALTVPHAVVVARELRPAVPA